MAESEYACIEPSLLDRIEVRESPIHGQGVFARRRLRPGQRVGVFEGERTQKDGTYVLWVESERGEEVGIRGRNALRFLNHGDLPNAEFRDAELFIVRNVQPGKELLISYAPAAAED